MASSRQANSILGSFGQLEGKMMEFPFRVSGEFASAGSECR